MGMMTSLQAAEKWKISKRQVNSLCANGRIPGARFENNRWMIPDDFDYPSYKNHGSKPAVNTRSGKYINIGNEVVLACVYAWGVGDAFAALVGKRFGRHKIKLPFADPHKSVEGSAAMFVTSAVAVTAVLLLRGGLGVGACILAAVAAAAVSTVAELCSKDGHDTFICPGAAMAVLLPLIRILEG